MKLGIQYWPETDMLTINLSAKPASGGGEEVTEGVVIHYDEADKVNFIEISGASELVDLSEIQANPQLVVDEQAGVIHTPSTMAEELGVSVESIHKTIQSMRSAGKEIGRRANEAHANSPQLFTADEFDQIKTWRQERRPGRPRKTEGGMVAIADAVEVKVQSKKKQRA